MVTNQATGNQATGNQAIGNQVTGADMSFDALLCQVSARLEVGEDIDLEQLAADAPEHAQRLRPLLPTLAAIAQLGREARDAGLPAGLSDAVDAEQRGTLGDFRLLREIGRGGMGVVYEAEQLSLARRVAIKVLPFASMLDPRQLARFRNEAQAAAQLHHTNIVPVLSVGCERGVHYYAMQYIEGQTLAQIVQQVRQLSGLEPPNDDGPAEPPSELAEAITSGRFAPAAANKSRDPDATAAHVPLHAHAPESQTPLPSKGRVGGGSSEETPLPFKGGAGGGSRPEAVVGAEANASLDATTSPSPCPLPSRERDSMKTPLPFKGGAGGGSRPEPAHGAIQTPLPFKGGVGGGSRPEPAPAGETAPIAALSTERSVRSPAYFRTVANLGLQAAEALEHAHSLGVIHRDIKPSNLLVDIRGNLWITDFGLAQMESGATLTMTGDILGTIRYMSPEQALAKRVLVDHRTDIYSLGVTLYEVLSLQPAFPADDRRELLRQIAFEEPKPLRRVNKAIPGELETIVLKAIAKNPAERYTTAQDLADDLQRFLMYRSIRARRPNVVQRMRKWLRRHRAATNVAAVAAILLLMLATGIAADRHRQVREGTRFVEISLQAARTALEADHVEQALLRLSEAQTRIDADGLADQALVEEAATLLQEAERYTKFVPLLEKARLDRSGEQVGIAAAEEALALYGVMDKPKWLDALRAAGLPEAHVQRVAEGVYTLLLLNADHLVRWSGEWPQPTREARLQAQCREAIECLEKAVAFHAPSRGYYWLLANCSLILGDKEKEKRLRTTALETPPHDAAELFYINRDRSWGTVSNERAYTFDESYKDHREMLRLDPTYYNALFFMVIHLAKEGRHDEALVAAYACVALRPDDWAAIFNRGNQHARLGHSDEAKADYELVLSLRPNYPRALGCIASALATNPNEATRDGIRAVKLATTACKLTDYKDAHIIDALASAYAETGDFKSAVKWSEMAVELDPSYRRNEYAKHLESFRQGKPWREE